MGAQSLVVPTSGHQHGLRLECSRRFGTDGVPEKSGIANRVSKHHIPFSNGDSRTAVIACMYTDPGVHTLNAPMLTLQ